MSVDVDAVNERLNGLVTLLKAVGVDSMSNEKGGTSSKKSGLADARQLDDAQIEAIIKKLQMAQTEAPQIIAALEAQAASKKRQQQQQHHHHQTQRTPQEAPERKYMEEEEEEESDEDSFDEDANYPMVGHGCSDDISVMSDLTTPTVVVGVQVPDEEHYRDTLPPMIVGGGRNDLPPMLIAPTKRKNLVGAVKPAAGGSAVRRPKPSSGTTGGAASQRRKHYNATMEKLAHEGTAPSSRGKPRSSDAKPTPSSKPHKTGSSSSRPQAGAPAPDRAERGSTVRKSSKSGRRASVGASNVADWDEPQQAHEKWSAFESSAATKLGVKQKPPPSTLIDDDGFLMANSIDASFDPFDAGAFNPFQGEKQKKSSSSSSGVKKSSSGAVKVPKAPSSNSSSGGNSGNSANGKPRRSRRASCM